MTNHARIIYTGDNLDVLRGMNTDSVDLIYLDPPFNSGRDYAAPVGSEAAGAAFRDTWTLSDLDHAEVGLLADTEPDLADYIRAVRRIHGDSMMSYLTMMAVRLIEMRRILAPSGSIYLHCDDTAGAYLRVLMDSIYGTSMFRNEITWKRTGSAAKGSQRDAKTWGSNADRLLFYSGGAVDPLVAPDDEEAARRFPKIDENGERYNTATPLFRAASMGDRPNLCYTWRGFTNPHPSGWRLSRGRLQEEFEKGNVVIDGDRIERRAYLRDYAGVPVGNIWTDLTLGSQAAERLGYPTQKPVALLERIIAASSNPGDLVLDPFAGCATACVAAERLGRQWIGIDISPLAAELVRRRLHDQLGLTSALVDHRTDLPRRTDTGDLPPYRTQKRTLYGIQAGDCAGCGHHFEYRHLEVDHIVPQSKGGTNEPENLQLLCGACNRTKGPRPMSYLMARLAGDGLAIAA